MSFLPGFIEKDIMGGNFFASITNGSFNAITRQFLNSSLSSALSFGIYTEFGEYGWEEIEIQNTDVVAHNFSIVLSDTVVGSYSSGCSMLVAIPGKGKVVVLLPFVGKMRYLSVGASCLFAINSWKLKCLPVAPTIVETAWGSAEGVAVATTGTVTNNGFDSEKVHSWTVLAGNTGGINYSVTPVPVEDSTWYSMELVSLVPVSLVLAGGVYFCQGTVKFILDSDFFISPLVTAMFNTQVISETVEVAFRKLVFNPNSNAWFYQNTVGA